MKKLHYSKIGELPITISDVILDTGADGDPAGNGYTTRYNCYAHPGTGNTEQSVIELIVMSDTDGDIVLTQYAEDANGDQMFFNHRWSDRASLTYSNIKL